MQTNDSNTAPAAKRATSSDDQNTMSSDNSSNIISSIMSSVSSAQKKEEIEIPEIKLGVFWDEWARCIGSRYQRDHLYRVGRLDSCSRQWKDLKTATRA
jgi:hypothetical protein